MKAEDALPTFDAQLFICLLNLRVLRVDRNSEQASEFAPAKLREEGYRSTSASRSTLAKTVKSFVDIAMGMN